MVMAIGNVQGETAAMTTFPETLNAVIARLKSLKTPEGPTLDIEVPTTMIKLPIVGSVRRATLTTIPIDLLASGLNAPRHDPKKGENQAELSGLDDHHGLTRRITLTLPPFGTKDRLLAIKGRPWGLRARRTR